MSGQNQDIDHSMADAQDQDLDEVLSDAQDEDGDFIKYYQDREPDLGMYPADHVPPTPCLHCFCDHARCSGELPCAQCKIAGLASQCRYVSSFKERLAIYDTHKAAVKVMDEAHLRSVIMSEFNYDLVDPYLLEISGMAPTPNAPNVIASSINSSPAQASRSNSPDAVVTAGNSSVGVARSGNSSVGIARSGNSSVGIARSGNSSVGVARSNNQNASVNQPGSEHWSQNSDPSFEEQWRQIRIPEELMAGYTAKYKLEALFVAEILKVGDVFAYSRQYDDGVKVDKHAELYDIVKGEDKYAFRFAPGQYKLSDRIQREDVEINVSGIEVLVSRICDQFGGLAASQKNKAAWKCTTIYRKGACLGTLHDIRQAWAFRLKESDFRYALKGENTLPSKKRQRLLPKTEFSPLFVLEDGKLYHIGGGSKVECDQRMAYSDGIPGPDSVSARTMFEQGPGAFKTPFQVQLAGGSGWTFGHAHLGPISLGLHKGLVYCQAQKFTANMSTTFGRGGLQIPPAKVVDGPFVTSEEWRPREVSGDGDGLAGVRGSEVNQDLQNLRGIEPVVREPEARRLGGAVRVPEAHHLARGSEEVGGGRRLPARLDQVYPDPDELEMTQPYFPFNFRSS